jgi:hypothetical protein
MTKKSGKRRNPTGTTGNYSSPHRGEKTKQTKVTPAKESETKGTRQTKLSFPTAGNNISPPTPSGTKALNVITPNDYAGTNHIRHPSPPTNPESPQTTRKHTPKNTTKDSTTTEATTKKTPPPHSNTVTPNDNDKKPAARTSNTTSNDEFKEPATTTETEQFTLVKKPPRRKKKVTTELTPPKLAKKDKPDTPTPPNPENHLCPRTIDAFTELWLDSIRRHHQNTTQ